MTAVLSGLEIAHVVEQRFPGSVVEASPEGAIVKADVLVEVCTYLRDDAELGFHYLVSLTAVDCLDYFEIVYHLQSIQANQLAVLKVRAHDREGPEVPSLTSVWWGALLQEREAYDLMGVRFRGHPDLRRVFLWEGFAGHPLRKDWLGMPGGLMPGLERFPGDPGGELEGRG